MLIVQGWLLHGARSDIGDLRTRLDQAHTSLGQIWETAKGLDQDRMRRLALLADSIRSVFDYAQGEVRLWSQRLDENDRNTATRLDDFARADQVQLLRLDGLERQNRTYSSAFEALARRAQSQETSARDFSTTVASLRATLGRLDGELAALEQRHAASTSTYAQLGRRVESLSGWADGFRQAGLSGEAVQGRFSTLADELRRIRIRVDSLRPMVRTAVSSETR